ncbi:delta subunit of the central stalk of mitochondrial F1F0 ATP synthase, atp16 [Ascosphaera aggregata]|nr:delta subunit of the central stalk of mitochondrial F1F0 ATP synthase, atp16 [Ascosphaera aggregata]
MSALRFSRAALRARPTGVAAAAFRPLVQQRRGYAEAVSDRIKLSLALPHKSIYASKDVYKETVILTGPEFDMSSVQVNIPAATGVMGVLANHVPSIEQLQPGVVEIIEENGSVKQFFLSGGFAVVQPDSQLSINSPEGFALEDFSPEAVRTQIAEVSKAAAGSGIAAEEAKIELEVCWNQINVLETLQASLNK